MDRRLCSCSPSSSCSARRGYEQDEIDSVEPRLNRSGLSLTVPVQFLVFCTEATEFLFETSLRPSRFTGFLRFPSPLSFPRKISRSDMALCNKLGSFFRQAISQNGPAPMAAMLNSARYMSSKLFIGGLSYGTDDQSLRDAFSSFGDVVDAKVITDRDTGRSRGFGFVNFSNDESATSAMSSMDGQELDGRNIRVSLANERPPAPRGYGGSGGGGGGFRGDGGYRGGNSGY